MNELTKKGHVYRASMNLLIALSFIVCGAAAGYGIGLLAALHSAAHTLHAYGADRLSLSDRLPDEGIAVLKTMNASPYPRCSEAELASFRKLVMEVHFIKDAGRMRGSQLECSTNLPKAELPDTNYSPAFGGSDNTLIYLKMNVLHIGPLIPIVMRIGDSYVSFDPYPRDVLPQATGFTMTMKNIPRDRPNFLGGSQFRLDNDLLTRNVDGRVSGNLFSTQCSPHYPTCLTVYVPVGTALMGQRRQIRAWVLIGMLTGLCCGLVGMLLYKRTKGIEQQLRRAVQSGALRVVYQPLFDMATRELVGAEALVRWTDEDGLAISPEVFIHIAEERGFVHLITKCVVGRVLDDFGEYLSKHPEFRVNVNVVALDLTDPGFLSMLEESLGDAGVSAQSLTIEITEGATARQEAAIEAIRRLRGSGHSVYIDDFGTGYSSLAYLKDLSVDGIKIDKAFTRSVGTESVTVSILPQILAMVDALQLGVVAEGIETEAQYEYYRNTGMPLVAQGWLFGYAVPVQEFRETWFSRVEEQMQSA